MNLPGFEDEPEDPMKDFGGNTNALDRGARIAIIQSIYNAIFFNLRGISWL